jgi:hypothetical protein
LTRDGASARVERYFNPFKQFRRGATRYEARRSFRRQGHLPMYRDLPESLVNRA